LLKELKLDEIDFPPPPRRAPPPEKLDPEDEYPGDAEPDGGAARPAPKPLPPVPFTEKEISKRMYDALAGFDTAAAAIDELVASGATLLEDVEALTKGLLSEGDVGFFISFLLHGWFTLVQPGTLAPELSFEAMEAEFARELAQVPSWMASGPGEAMNKMIAGCRQPALMQLLMAEMLEAATKAPKKQRPNPQVMIPMIAILKTVINEVDRALRAL